MQFIIHRADSRGLAEHGWLTSYHTFSFADYHDPERMRFGVVRVLNDDTVQAGKGFGMHPHDNMEIISIPIKGALEHKDNMGSGSVIHEHDVQIMSAGTGLYHSEFNHSKSDSVNFLQIWIFPKERNIQPRYKQKTYHPETLHNRFQLVLSPKEQDGSLWINQDAWISLGAFDAGRHVHYTLQNKDHGIYLFVIEGSVDVEDEQLDKRDGMGLWELKSLNLKAKTSTRILLMEVPMN